MLRNLDTSEFLVVKVGVDDPDPTRPSVVPLWPGADWMEREVFDMYGIKFTGHPDLRRILMPDEFAAFPLRKDYPLRGRGERHNFPSSPRRIVNAVPPVGDRFLPHRAAVRVRPRRPRTQPTELPPARRRPGFR